MPATITVTTPDDLVQLSQKIAALETGQANLQADVDKLLNVVPPPPPPVNKAPVWGQVPPILFSQGVPAKVSIAAYVTDPDSDPLTVTLFTSGLPPGVTYSPDRKSVV